MKGSADSRRGIFQVSSVRLQRGRWVDRQVRRVKLDGVRIWNAVLSRRRERRG